MENCLVTKLKEVVNNECLPMMGELSLYVNSSTNIPTAIVKSGDLPASIRISEGVVATSTGTRYPLFKGTGYVYVKEKNSIIELGTSDAPSSPFIITDYDDIKYCTLISNLRIFNNNVKGLDTIEKLDVFPLTTLLINTFTLNGDFANLSSLQNTLATLSIRNINGLQSNMSKLALFKSLSYIESWDSTVFNGALEDFVAKRCTMGTIYKTGSLRIRYPHFNENVKFIGSDLARIEEGTLNWVPSGENIEISFDSASTIIHVNSDGTWTRIS